jgi:Tfp pilus assembly protein PilX
MDAPMKNRRAWPISSARNLTDQGGFVLIAALTLMSTLVLVGATAYLLSSTDIKIGGNFKNNQMVLQAAIGGSEHAREALRTRNLLPTSNKLSFSDELIWARGTNLLGIVTLPITDGLMLANGTMNSGTTTYRAYLSNDLDANGVNSIFDANGKVMITSVATGPDNSKAQVQTVVSFNAGPSSPATIYAKGNFSGSGIPLVISGNDNSSCGAASLAPAYTKDPATGGLSGAPLLSGSPSSPQHGPLDIDVAGYIDALKSDAIAVTHDETNRNFGTSTDFVTVYSDTSLPNNDAGLSLTGGTGYGILLVRGDLVLGGGFQWNGLVFATGSVTINGSGGGVNIRGQIYTGTSSANNFIINGAADIRYHSCNVKLALALAPLKIVSWKHVY